MIHRSRLDIQTTLRDLDSWRARWNLAYCALKGHMKRRLPSRFPASRPVDARFSFVVRGIALGVPREVLTPPIWRGLVEGWYESEELDQIAELLRSDDVVLELGTGLGFVSTYAARQPGVRRVVTVEANPRLVEIARYNHCLNGARVEAINAVVAAEDGITTFYLHEDFWISSMAPQPGAAPVRLPARSISGLLAEVRPTVLIVDIEGGEASIFEGVDLSTVREAIIEVHPAAVGARGVHCVFLHMAAAGLYYDPLRSSGAIVVFSRAEEEAVRAIAADFHTD